MKLLNINKIGFALFTALTFTACEKTYDAPPLNEPIYTGAPANITISELRKQYPATTEKPLTIEKDLILKAYVSGEDQSGNIYKKIFIQDATGGLEVEVDQTNIYNHYRTGQEIYIDLKGLSMSVYGDEPQLGHPQGTNFRIPWDIFTAKFRANGWASTNNVVPTEISDLSTLNTDVEKYKFTLVTLKDVRFQNGGKNPYAPTSGYGQELLTDAKGNNIVVRTSNYADFAAKILPKGQGSITGILGRFKGAWQFTLRSIKDVGYFDGTDNPTTPITPPTEVTLFSENFGTPVKENNQWPLFADYKGFQNPKEMFETIAGSPSVRVVSNYTNVWFPTKADAGIRIKDIASTVKTATLEIALGANVYKAGESQDLNAFKIKLNDTEIVIPSKVIAGDNQEGNKPFSFKFENVALKEKNTIDISIANADNKFGMRLYSIKLYTSSGSDNGGNTINPNPNN